MPIRRLDRYILWEVLGPCLGGLIFFSFVFLMFQMVRLAELFIVHGISGKILLKMVFLLMMTFLPTALPIAFLIGIMIAFGRLSADSELIAMKANGISLRRLSVPVLGIGVVVMAMSLVLNLEWAPGADRVFKSTLIRVSNTKVASSIKAGTFTSGFFDLLIYVDKLDTRSNKLYRVFIYDEREPKNPLAVVAKEGEIVSLKPQSQLGAAAILKLNRGNIHRNDIGENTYQKVDFGEYRLFLNIDEGADTASVKPRMYSLDYLLKQIRTSVRGTRANAEYRAELSRRFAVAFSPLIFVFLGIGYGTVRSSRAVKASAAMIALCIIVGYWILQSVALGFALDGWLHPEFSMWIPNLALLALAVLGYRAANW